LAGNKLSGPLYSLYSFHFKSDNVNYRIAYTIDRGKHEVVIHLADTRENFYQKLRRLFK
jgi:mRNA-degrading endonuclease RelE of RelBE toxin-antitoxin system